MPVVSATAGIIILSYFISEISDYKRQQNPRALPQPPAFASPLPARNALCQNGFPLIPRISNKKNIEKEGERG